MGQETSGKGGDARLVVQCVVRSSLFEDMKSIFPASKKIKPLSLLRPLAHTNIGKTMNKDAQILEMMEW